MIFALHFVIVPYYPDLFVYFEPYLHLRDESQWIMVYDPLKCW